VLEKPGTPFVFYNESRKKGVVPVKEYRLKIRLKKRRDVYKMKRKFLSVLIALVLVLSFSWVTALPAAAAPDTFNVVPFEFQTTGGGTAEWSTAAAHTGSWGVNIGTDTDGTDYGRVAFAWNQNLSTITDMSYWYNLQAGNGSPNWDSGPYMNIEIDTDDDDVTDAWVLHKMFFLSPGIGTWLQWKLSDDPIDSQYMEFNSTTMWHVWDGSAMTDYALWSDVLAVHGSHTAIKIKIAVGDWASNIETRHYVDDIQINGVTYCGKIQDAIDTASTDDIISVAAGTYTEDLDIPATKTNLELVGATGTTIKGIQNVPVASWPLGMPNIEILADGVKIHGFTIQGPDYEAGYYTSGIILDGTDIEIYDNDFVTTPAETAGEIAHAITTISKEVFDTADVSGLYIHDNTFTGSGAVGSEFIYINPHTGSGTITIDSNQFSGSTNIGITVESGNTIADNNTISSNLGHDTLPYGTYGIRFMDTTYSGVYNNIVISDNNIQDVKRAIRVGNGSPGDSVFTAVIDFNILTGNDIAIWGRLGNHITAANNIIVGNAVGVQNDDATVTINAEYNWYGGVAGPQHGTNPYDTEAGNQGNDTVSNDVDFLPWMIHDTLASGWNIWSTPIAAATGQAGEPDTNSVDEALDFWGADSTKVTDAYYFDSSSQAWATPTSLTPLQAVYLKLSDTATIDVCVSDSNYAPPGRTMHLGWNLVGTADWDDYKLVDQALLSAEFGTGAVNLIGYQYVMSPSIHQTSWTFTRGDTATTEYFVPTEGYWVYMVNQGVLNGFTYTPIIP